jgi:hypothetical protein
MGPNRDWDICDLEDPFGTRLCLEQFHVLVVTCQNRDSESYRQFDVNLINNSRYDVALFAFYQ